MVVRGGQRAPGRGQSPEQLDGRRPGRRYRRAVLSDRTAGIAPTSSWSGHGVRSAGLSPRSPLCRDAGPHCPRAGARRAHGRPAGLRRPRGPVAHTGPDLDAAHADVHRPPWRRRQLARGHVLRLPPAADWNPDLALEASVWRSSDGVWVVSEERTTGRVFDRDLTITSTPWSVLATLRTKVGGHPMARAPAGRAGRVRQQPDPVRGQQAGHALGRIPRSARLVRRAGALRDQELLGLRRHRARRAPSRVRHVGLLLHRRAGALQRDPGPLRHARPGRRRQPRVLRRAGEDRQAGDRPHHRLGERSHGCAEQGCPRSHGGRRRGRRPARRPG